MMKDNIEQFFQVCKNNKIILEARSNEIVRFFCELLHDQYVTFPKIDSSNIICFGYPGPSYLEDRWKEFKELVQKWRHRKISHQDITSQLLLFLQSCHGDDSTPDNEMRMYVCLINKAKLISDYWIKNAFPLLIKQKNKKQLSYPCSCFYRPVGAAVNVSKIGDTFQINDVQNIRLNFDFFKLKCKDFLAEFIVSVKWEEKDTLYYNSKDAKWQDIRINGIDTSQIKVYIKKCSIDINEIKKSLLMKGISSSILKEYSVKDSDELSIVLSNAKKRRHKGIMVDEMVIVGIPAKVTRLTFTSDTENNYDLQGCDTKFAEFNSDLLERK